MSSLAPGQMLALDDARAWLAARCPRLPSEPVAVLDAGRRVLAADLRASGLPAYAVAAIDGQAVRAAETEGASEYSPLPVGGSAVVAGTAMPSGTDAVLPYSALDAGPAALAPVARGYGVLRAGHDAREGWTMEAGTRLTPLHLALLARLGRQSVDVVRQPRVDIGAAAAKNGADALTPLLHGLVAVQSGHVVEGGANIRVLAGRSGGGPDDDGVRAFSSVFAHGIAVRPGETAALGMIGQTPGVLLPGDPLACATAFALLVAPVLRQMGGLAEPGRVPARLGRKIASSLGRCDAVRVRVVEGVATPIGPAEGGSLSLGLAADGLVLAPEGSEGYAAGAIVEVVPL